MAKTRKNLAGTSSDPLLPRDPSPPQTDPTTPDVVEDAAPAEAEDPAPSPPQGIRASVSRLFGSGESD